ncbi:class II fructose-bisphosphate aldolase family protein [bacterium]|nr:class II fructose-bisphosphate aldolase family protein [bacterium]
MLVHIKEIVKEAEKGKYAIGAFNVHNLESILGVAQAAIRAKSPAIIQVSEGAIKYMGLKPVTHIVSTVAKNIAAHVPIALHLDHGRSFESVFECIRAGFSSVHIDASNLPIDENIALTSQVVELAHRKKVWVQGEVGAIMGGHGQITGRIEDIPIAKVEDVVNFVGKTKVDTIAAAIGTAHGVFDNEDIIIDLLREIKDKTKKPFVLHGGSGVPEEKIKNAIKEGVNIINIGTDIKVAFTSTLIKNCKDNPKETDPRKLLKPTIGAVEKVVYNSMKLFGSQNKADFQDIET